MVDQNEPFFTIDCMKNITLLYLKGSENIRITCKFSNCIHSVDYHNLCSKQNNKYVCISRWNEVGSNMEIFLIEEQIQTNLTVLRCHVKTISFFLSLYTARPSFEYYRQVYFVHSGLQDESLQVTISKLP